MAAPLPGSAASAEGGAAAAAASATATAAAAASVDGPGCMPEGTRAGSLHAATPSRTRAATGSVVKGGLGVQC